MADDNILKTPGEILGETRERQGLSLEALSERTKIPVKVIAALEMDEYYKVSGPLYIKSFLRTCAVDLGLDPDHIIDLYSRFGGESGTRAGGEDMVWQEDQVKVTHVGLPWPRILLVGGATAVAVGVILFAIRGCGTREPGSTETGPVNSVEARTPEDLRSASQPVADTSRTTAEEEAAGDQTTSDAAMTPDGEEGLTATSPTEPEDEGGETQAGATTRAAPTETQKPRETTAPPEPTKPEAAQDEPAYEDRDEPPVPPARSGGLPPAIAGNAGTPFANGQSWPVVMRLITDLPVGVEIMRDKETEYHTAAWNDPVALPVRGIRPGRAYGVREGLVVYWGAQDHFSLRLDRVAGVEVSINGVVRDLSTLRPGQELILDDHSAADTGR